MNKEEFVNIMLKNEQFKKAEKRRNLIIERKRKEIDYLDFTIKSRVKEQRRKKLI